MNEQMNERTKVGRKEERKEGKKERKKIAYQQELTENILYIAMMASHVCVSKMKSLCLP